MGVDLAAYRDSTVADPAMSHTGVVPDQGPTWGVSGTWLTQVYVLSVFAFQHMPCPGFSEKFWISVHELVCLGFLKASSFGDQAGSCYGFCCGLGWTRLLGLLS